MGILYSHYLFPEQRPARYRISADGESLGFQTTGDSETLNWTPLLWLNTGRSRIPAAYFPAVDTPEQRQTILFSHGNAEDMGFSMFYAYKLARALNVNVLCYEYTGYGLSQGKTDDTPVPKCSEIQMARDILTAYEYLIETGCVPKDIVLFGRSLGSGPSCRLASIRPVGGLVLISALASALQVAMPWFKLDLAGVDMFRNLHLMKTGKIVCPTLVVHGMKDEIVPISHSKSLLDACPTPAFCPFYHLDAGHDNVEQLDWKGICVYYSEFLYSIRTGMLSPSSKTRQGFMSRMKHNLNFPVWYETWRTKRTTTYA